MSIVRIGLSEQERFAAGYEAIFGKKKPKKTPRSGSRARAAARNKKRKK
jgi:hypothetical protein